MYKPDQRQVPVQLLTRAGWISGTFHPPAKSALVEFLNRPGEFLRMTDVSVQGRVGNMPFLAMHRESMMLIVPPATEKDLELGQTGAQLEERSLTCLLETGVLDGRVRVHPGQRVSDFFAKREGFVLVQKARLLLRSSSGEPTPLVKEPALIVNTDWVLGVADGPAIAAGT